MQEVFLDQRSKDSEISCLLRSFLMRPTGGVAFGSE